jgi:prepilin-type processing-associated H-X9-DG protein
VELLVVIAIIGLLIALLLPAVQAAREAARRSQCVNNLKQMSLAWINHVDANRYMPTGGWGWTWTGDPDRGFGLSQPGGWTYNILPFMEESNLHDMGKNSSLADKYTAAAARISVGLPVFYCPSRRTGTLFTNTIHPIAVNSNDLNMVARTDYAANCGNETSSNDGTCGNGEPNQCNGGPPDYATGDNGFAWAASNTWNGVSYQHSMVTMRMMQDGTSYTAMIGEKYLNGSVYLTGTDGSDNEDVYVGFDNDTFKTTAYPPSQDIFNLPDDVHFGSIHSSAMNMAFCDGSVRQITYEIDQIIFAAVGSRNGAEIIDNTSLAQ